MRRTIKNYFGIEPLQKHGGDAVAIGNAVLASAMEDSHDNVQAQFVLATQPLDLGIVSNQKQHMTPFAPEMVDQLTA